MSFSDFNQEDNKLVRAMDLRNEKKNKNMREIKFNAWNKVNNTMHLNILDPANWSFSYLNQDIFIWLQYTGLKDKNLVDIYEGDIIELVNDSGEKIRVVCEFGIARRDVMSGGLGVEVDIPSFYFLLSNGKKSFPIVNNYAGNHDLDLFEIIGNIYQNPSLLK